MTSHCSLVGMMIATGPCEVATITKYSASRDSYYLESSNGREKGWMLRVMVETGLLSCSMKQAYPMWAPMIRPLGSRPGGIIVPMEIASLPKSC